MIPFTPRLHIVQNTKFAHLSFFLDDQPAFSDCVHRYFDLARERLSLPAQTSGVGVKSRYPSTCDRLSVSTLAGLRAVGSGRATLTVLSAGWDRSTRFD